MLVRHLSDERIENFVRITVGSEEENEKFLKILTEIEEDEMR